MANGSSITGGTVTWVLDVDSNGLITGMVKARGEVKAFSDSVNKVDYGKFADNASKAFGSVADTIGKVIKVAAGLGAVGAGFGAVFIKSAADLQQTSKSMEVLTGNTEVANKLFAKFADYANNTPFEFPDIAKGGKTLLGFGISADKVYDDIRVLGDIAAATGADFGSLATVFGQVNATGKLMGQDALQLINNNVPITTILAKKLGKTVQQVKQDMEDGSISADIFNEALTGVTKEGGFAFKGVDVLAQSFNGRMSTLKDTVLEFGRNLLGVKVDPELGLVIEPGGIFDRLSNLLPQISKSLEDLAPKFKKGFVWVIDNADSIKSAMLAIGAGFLFAKSAMFLFAVQAMITDGVMKRNLIAAALTAIVVALVYLQDKYDIFGKAADFIRSVLEKVGPAISAIADIAEEVAKKGLKFLQDRLEDVQGAFKATQEWFEKHKEGLKQIAEVITVVMGPAFLKLAAQATAAALVMAVQAAIAAGAWVINAAIASAAWTVNFAIMSAQAVAHAIVSGFQAVISGTVWVAQAALAGGAWLLHFGLMILKAIATAVVFVAQAALAGYAWVFQAGLASAAWVASAATSSGAVTGLRALIASPVAMGAITIVAAIAALDQVLKAVQAVRQAIRDVDAASDAAISKGRSNTETINTLNDLIRNGTPEQKARAKKALQGLAEGGSFASGTNFAPGGLSLVGEEGPELVNLKRGSQVIPNHKLNSMAPSIFEDQFGSSTTKGSVIINQKNEIYNQVDLDAVTRELAWRVNR